MAYYEDLELQGTPGHSQMWLTGRDALYCFPNDDGVTVAAAFLLNAGPLAAKALSEPDQSRLVSDFTYGVLVTRVPLFMFQAVQAALLPKLARLAAAGLMVPQILAIEGVARADVTGGLEQQVLVTLEPDKLAAANVSSQQVVGIREVGAQRRLDLGPSAIADVAEDDQSVAAEIADVSIGDVPAPVAGKQRLVGRSEQVEDVDARCRLFARPCVERVGQWCPEVRARVDTREVTGEDGVAAG